MVFKMVFRVVALLALMMAVPGAQARSKTQRPPCPVACPFIYDPVCGSDGKTYSNDCALSIANCHDSTITKASDGECGKRECPKFCPLNYEPACGSNGKTYSNDCFLNIAICHDATITSAPCLARIACPVGCPKHYRPVCGTDGETYVNSCLLSMVTCKDATVTLAHKGPCTDDPVVTPACFRKCSKHYRPVCGTDGKTYANECLLAVANCKDSTITLHYKGRCDD